MNKIFKASLIEGSRSFDDMSLPELEEADKVIRDRMSSIIFHSSDTDASTFDEIQDFNLHRIIQVTAAKKRISGENKNAEEEKS